MTSTLAVFARRVVMTLFGAVLLGAALTVAAATPAAHAEVDPGAKPWLFEVQQEGQTVGEVFVMPWHAAGEGLPAKASYVEHWVLFPGYAYPSPANGKAFTLRPAADQRYRSETDFFARVPFAPGARYLRVDVTDSASLPGR